MKRICRHLDIQSWPYRQIAGINRTIVRLEAELEESIRSLVPCPLGGPVGEGSSASRAISEHIKDLVDHREQIINVCGLFPPSSLLPLLSFVLRCFLSTESPLEALSRGPNLLFRPSVLVSLVNCLGVVVA